MYDLCKTEIINSGMKEMLSLVYHGALANCSIIHFIKTTE